MARPAQVRRVGLRHGSSGRGRTRTRERGLPSDAMPAAGPVACDAQVHPGVAGMDAQGELDHCRGRRQYVDETRESLIRLQEKIL